MDRLVEARQNRQENKPRPYRQFRKPFSQNRREPGETTHDRLRNKTGEISPNSVEIPKETEARTTLGEISHIKPHKTDHLDESNSEKDFETDILISPGDVYPNRKVKLEDADITEETKKKFEEMCDRHPEAFSRNNKDIGRTTLIKMEIDMGDSLPVAQNPYTLPLKHHESVRKEIETLEKAGVIE